MRFAERENPAVRGLYKVTLWVTIYRPCIYCELNSFFTVIEKALHFPVCAEPMS